MPLQSPKRIISDAERKLLLLYCVRELHGATANQLWTFAAELDLMEYIPMRLCMHELLASGELENGVGAMRELLLLTTAGRHAIELFAERVPASDRERIRDAAPMFRARMLQHTQVRAIYEMAQKGDVRVRLSLCEGDLPTLAIRLSTKNRGMASRAIRSFRLRAPAAVTYLYGLSADGGPQGDAASIVRYSSTEFMANVTLSMPRLTFEVSLLFPSMESARRFMGALAAPERRLAAAQTLAAQLCGARRR